jgi:hypothetical protein
MDTDKRIGYIYRHTSPSGKSYIGQTVHDPMKRWAQHVLSATKNLNMCTAFERAIRKHGSENFLHETLLITNACFLDQYEVKFIDMYNTISPRGYNLRAGGDGRCSQEMIDAMVRGNEKKLANKKMWGSHVPVKYVVWYHETNKHGTHLEGYRVTDHPNGVRKVFASKSMSMDEKYKLAVEYKLFLDLQETYYDERTHYPQYVKRTKKGFSVNVPGHKYKSFASGSLDADLAKAMGYLKLVCPEPTI